MSCFYAVLAVVVLFARTTLGQEGKERESEKERKKEREREREREIVL